MSDTDPDPDPDADADADPDVDSNATTDADPDVDPNATTDADPDPDPNATTDADREGPDESAAVASLERLGLSNYEARVFVALQRLGVATAKEVHEAAGVPRSQVYGAADGLVERGLVERQQSTPKRYRAVSPEAARARLAARIEREQDRAFDYLRRARREGGPEEVREDVWSVRGPSAVGERTAELVGRATDRVVFAAASVEAVADEVRAALAAAVDRGVAVTVLTTSPAVEAALEDVAHTVVPPPERAGGHTGRMLLVDDDAVLVSVRTGEGETAIWSADTAMADVLVQTIHAGVRSMVGDGDPSADDDAPPDGGSRDDATGRD